MTKGDRLAFLVDAFSTEDTSLYNQLFGELCAHIQSRVHKPIVEFTYPVPKDRYRQTIRDAIILVLDDYGWQVIEYTDPNNAALIEWQFIRNGFHDFL